MGVHGLWELLAPVGRRVSVETLAGKKLAIDASIWMVQFMKAMRDERGEMVRNAHLLGFFRRICKLLYLRTKPVFVFDGGTPALKRRTVIARRRQRENAQSKIRKTAEKLLLNQLKTMRLKELEKDLDNQRRNQKKDDAKSRKSEVNETQQKNSSMGTLDQVGCSSMSRMAAEGESSKTSVAVDEVHTDDDTEMILPEITEAVDPDVFSALPPSIQRDLLRQRENDKGKKILVDDPVEAGKDGCYNQEKLDEMLAASIAAEEDGDLTYNNTSSSAAVFQSEEEDGDEDEEMLLPAFQGSFDPAVLASLPPSMQLDLLAQMRERLMAENRQKYQKVKKAPEKFSELQIQSYLKTVAFRREIDQVQKAAAGRGVGGIQTSRIASEANREFIFSSSFTGDKQALASGRGLQSGDTQTLMQSEQSSLVPSSSTASGNRSKVVSGLIPDESRSEFNDDVETYLDERGRVRLNKVRAMGIRMTRDLQRNLELMKEVEPEMNGEKQFVETTHSVDENLIENKQSSKNGTSIEISLDFDGENKHSDDDDIFSTLVAGDPVEISSDSEIDWEEGTLDGKSMDLSNENQAEVEPSYKESEASYESEVEWEEHTCDVLNKLKSKGDLVEESDLQEAIKRSLLDQKPEKSDHVPEIDKISESPLKNAVQAIIDGENSESCNTATKKIESFASESKSSFPDDKGVLKNAQTDTASHSEQVKLVDGSDRVSEAVEEQCFPDDKGVLKNDQTDTAFDSEQVKLVDACDRVSEAVEEQCFDSSDGNDGLSIITDSAHGDVPDTLSVGVEKNDNKPESSIKINEENVTETKPFVIVEDEKNDVESEPSIPISHKKNYAEGESSFHSVVTAGTSNPLVGLSIKESRNVEVEQKKPLENTQDNYFTVENMGKSVESPHIEYTEARMEEEMLILDEERANLGDEWRKLERNAESVSSEMFAECQELLQMFGIPFIIAPMEAEAQCAYLELANLVDGIVTDDSDVFLFGGKNIFKNIFDDRKYVETYFMKDVENELGLTREKLIRMALLLGSDYTEGISGIGIVNAIEVLNAFPEEDGFCKFREWIESPDPTILGTLGSSTQKRDGNGSKDGAQKDIVNEEIKQIFMDKHRNVSKNWNIPSDFPSEAVMSEYSSPQVDKSTESFAWAKPDLLGTCACRLCWEKFGWGSQKSDELLLPVLKEYNKRETQLRLEAFYTFNERFAKVRSKRIKKAVKGITANKSSVLAEDAEQEVSKKPNKRKVRPSDDNANTRESVEKSTSKKVKKSNVGKATSKKTRKRRDHEEHVTSDSDNEQKINGEKPEGSEVVRRSTRSRRHVNYTLDDVESEDTGKSVVGGNTILSVEESAKQDSSFDDDINRSRRDDLELGNHSVEEGFLQGDYLESGGGFCTEEAVTGPLAAENQDMHLEADELSKDYLTGGGGFCLEENEAAADQGFETRRNVDSGGNKSASDHLNVEASSLQEKRKEDAVSVTSSVAGLRAMPFLRKKRRKN
ncbi:hypothetical protein ACFE04_007494 [Oxalis oulophora]